MTVMNWIGLGGLIVELAVCIVIKCRTKRQVAYLDGLSRVKENGEGKTVVLEIEK